MDLHSALSRLAALPLSQPAEADRQLGELLDRLLADPPAPRILFQILENAGDALYFVREMAAQKFQPNAPHLKPAEEALFGSGIATWRKVVDAYILCTALQDSAGPGDGLDAELAEYEATLLHRCLYYSGMLILDHYRAKRAVPAETWLRFHCHYRRAEDLGIAELAVRDLLQEEGGRTDCKSIWITFLLLEAASPYSRDSGELGLILRWAFREASLVGVEPVQHGKKTPPFLVVPSADAPLVPSTPALAARPDACRLETSALGAKIAQALDELAKGQSPAWLGIGENGMATAERLLRQLQPAWSLKTGRRRFRRAAIRATASVCTGFNAMHYFIRHNNHAPVPTPGSNGQARIDYQTESWEVLDQSPGGFRLASSNAATLPVNGQLIAFLPHDGERFLLGQIHWVKREQDDRLLAGVAVLPGIPQALSIQIDSRIKGQPPIQACAFLLSALPAMGAPDSVVLPAGLYRPERSLASDHRCCRSIVPESLIQSGPDFERISFRTL